jgi:NADP-dependent 3-hydroxy acid dehydrogenase YdfG
MPERNLNGRVAIVTGAGKGIGRAICLALVREGASVVAAARTFADLQQVAELCRAEGGKVLPIQMDVTSETEVEGLVARTLEEYGQIDLLVNNAGIGVFKPVVEMPVADLEAMWNVNLKGVFMMCKAVLPGMIRKKGGCIVNISSLAGKNGVKNGAGYSATKWALRGFAASMMLEVREHNIRVVTIFPGSVDTHFGSRGLRGSHITQPEDVADAVVFAASVPHRTMVSEIDLRPTRP